MQPIWYILLPTASFLPCANINLLKGLSIDLFYQVFSKYRSAKGTLIHLPKYYTFQYFSHYKNLIYIAYPLSFWIHCCYIPNYLSYLLILYLRISHPHSSKMPLKFLYSYILINIIITFTFASRYPTIHKLEITWGTAFLKPYIQHPFLVETKAPIPSSFFQQLWCCHV